jgi:DNA mismatch repair ATPase MutS
MITKKPQRKIKSDKINGLPEIAALKTLEEIFSMKNKMAEVIDWYEKKQKNVIEIPELKINARALHGNLTLKTYKLYESAIKKITDFIEKHPQFKQQDIISQALIEFAEKYH